MAIAPFENALLQKFGESGTDGPGGTGIENDSRTPSLEVGGHTFTVVLKDSAGVQDDVRVQVNNANPVDPNKPHHAASLQEYANDNPIKPTNIKTIISFLLNIKFLSIHNLFLQ